MLDKILRIIKKLIPRKLFSALQPAYHFTLTLLGALIYRFPSREILIVGVTGTKGKSTTAEFVNAILEANGMRTALLGTIRFKIGSESKPNLRKMTIPGRFFVQKFLRDAINANCTWVVLELTSESVKQFRHKWIGLDALIFTNLAPEHIESHGSYEKYRDAKLEIAKLLTDATWPRKVNTVMVANADDKEGDMFLTIGADKPVPYKLADGAPYELSHESSTFTFRNTQIRLHVPGIFNITNALGAATFAESQGVPISVIKQGLESVGIIRGRVEYIREGQPFDVVVDYAHTPDSLESFYTIFRESKNIAVLGNTGGGRDTWKRGTMAGIAEKNAVTVILTNEDPYDENPEAITDAMLEGIENKMKVRVIMDRREAIREALATAYDMHTKHRDERIAVLITGKGTDPFIMGKNGSKLTWDDATVTREEIRALMHIHKHA
ncbi:MAG: UDP-N-acetylmuramyl-tripeptide synthetase [Patescibacteria group bacterium]